MQQAIKILTGVLIVFLAGCATAPPGTVQQQKNTDNTIVGYAMDLVGTPYVYGGKDPESGLDCSGFVSLVYTRAGVPLTGSAADMARKGRHIGKSQLAPGDLVFFNTLGRPYSHVGIYIGQGRFVHAPRPGERVRVSELDNPYFSKRFDAARTYQAAASSAIPATASSEQSIDDVIQTLMAK